MSEFFNFEPEINKKELIKIKEESSSDDEIRKSNKDKKLDELQRKVLSMEVKDIEGFLKNIKKYKNVLKNGIPPFLLNFLKKNMKNCSKALKTKISRFINEFNVIENHDVFVVKEEKVNLKFQDKLIEIMNKKDVENELEKLSISSSKNEKLKILFVKLGIYNQIIRNKIHNSSSKSENLINKNTKELFNEEFKKISEKILMTINEMLDLMKLDSTTNGLPTNSNDLNSNDLPTTITNDLKSKDLPTKDYTTTVKDLNNTDYTTKDLPTTITKDLTNTKVPTTNTKNSTDNELSIENQRIEFSEKIDFFLERLLLIIDESQYQEFKNLLKKLTNEGFDVEKKKLEFFYFKCNENIFTENEEFKILYFLRSNDYLNAKLQYEKLINKNDQKNEDNEMNEDNLSSKMNEKNEDKKRNEDNEMNEDNKMNEEDKKNEYNKKNEDKKRNENLILDTRILEELGFHSLKNQDFYFAFEIYEKINNKNSEIIKLTLCSILGEQLKSKKFFKSNFLPKIHNFNNKFLLPSIDKEMEIIRSYFLFYQGRFKEGSNILKKYTGLNVLPFIRENYINKFSQ